MKNSKEYLIYYNLHNNLWSIKDTKTKHVVGHAGIIILADVQPVVSENGRQRVIKERRKNVHAYLRGKIVSLGDFHSYKGRRKPAEATCRNHSMDGLDDYRPITYNPYARGDFYYKDDDKTFTSADTAFLSSDRRVYVA